MRTKQVTASFLARTIWSLRLSGTMASLASSIMFRPDRGANRRFMPFSRRTTPAVPILNYHRFTTEKPDPFFPGTPIKAFEAQVRFLKSHYEIVSLPQLVNCLMTNDPLPRRSLALTFDDGYRDNFTLAFPVLQKYRIPATIFLTTDFIDQVEVPWNDKVAYALKRTKEERISVGLGTSREFILDLCTEASRLKSLDYLLFFLRRIPHQQKLLALNEIFKELQINDFPPLRGSMLTWNQVRLMKGGGITFGAHTVSHPILTRISLEDSRKEIRDCRSRIESELDDTVELFAYPNGRDLDFGQHHKQLAKEAGYRAACTTIHGLNTPDTDRYELRRGGPHELTIPEFAMKLAVYKIFN